MWPQSFALVNATARENLERTSSHLEPTFTWTQTEYLNKAPRESLQTSSVQADWFDFEPDHLFINDLFSLQACWWMRPRTTARPSTSRACASFRRQCLSSSSTSWFRGEKPPRPKCLRRTVRWSAGTQKGSSESFKEFKHETFSQEWAGSVSRKRILFSHFLFLTHFNCSREMLMIQRSFSPGRLQLTGKESQRRWNWSKAGSQRFVLNRWTEFPVAHEVNGLKCI